METPAPPDSSAVGISPKPWGIPAVLAALTIPGLLWGASLAIAITQDGAEDFTDSEIVTGLILTLVLDVALIGLAAGLALQRYRLSWAQLGLRPFDRRFWWLPLVVATAAHLGIIVYALTLTAIGAGAAVPEQEIDELFESRAVLPLVGVVTVLMAPLAEEIFFRGFIFPGLLRPFGLGGAMAASGLLFGAFHITSPDTVGLIVPFGLVGALFAWLYHRTGSLWPSVAAHLVFNLVSFVILASVVGNGSS